MDLSAPDRPFALLLLPPGVALTPGALGLLLAYARRRRGGGAPWGGAAAEAFAGPRGTLLLVRPAVSAAVAPYALPCLHNFFTE